MFKCTYACGSDEHQIARRSFLGMTATGMGAIAGGLGMLAQPAAAKKLASDQKRVIVVNMAGGLSQLESWDPKPGTPTGGPFRAIPTSVPGIHICELLPETAKQMHHLALVRGVNIHENDHGKGGYKMFYGRPKTPAAEYPRLGAVMARTLESDATESLPGHINVTPGGGGGRGNDSAYLGPRYASISLDNGKPPQNSKLPDSIKANTDGRRQAFRRAANDAFLQRRRTAFTDAYTHNYEQALQLMQRRDVFDIEKEPQKDRDRYGSHDFGRHCLLARRLLDSGVTFVQVTHTNYDTHNENFNFHLEQLGEFDTPFACLVNDLAERGMLDSTLIVVLSEFGRTPRINQNYGRDHWGTAWSICMGGAKVQRGATYGKTNDQGTAVTEGEVNHAQLFHTYLQAVGVDSEKQIDIDGRPVPLADPAFHPVKELLA
ncbi:MAG: DUF1501 domain-containing protein [Pirellulaceae bacterium]